VTTRLHRPGLCAHLTVAAATALALTGCATSPPPAAPATPAATPTATVTPDTQTVAWTDSVCRALVPVAQSLLNPPEVNVTAPAATRNAYLSYLAKSEAATDGAIKDVTAAGRAPVDNGQQIADNVRDQLTDLRNDLGQARTHLEQADPNDAVGIGRSVIAAGNVVGAVGNSAQALRALNSNPQLDAAFNQAKSCQQLRSMKTPGKPAGG
jgi:hypothetical protein